MKKLVAWMLRLEPEERPNVEQVLKHEWLVDFTDIEQESSADGTKPPPKSKWSRKLRKMRCG